MDQRTLAVTLKDGTYILMHFTDSGNEWDACVDHDVYESREAYEAGKDPRDGGQMDFNWDETSYEKIEDAVNDVISFSIGIDEPRIASIEVIE